ncbi:MAG: hypothetical protein ACXVCV_14375 [Polyangia bacterium]
MKNLGTNLKNLVDSAVALEEHEAFVARLTAELPEARVIKQVTDDHTARVITFELLTEER